MKRSQDFQNSIVPHLPVSSTCLHSTAAALPPCAAFVVGRSSSSAGAKLGHLKSHVAGGWPTQRFSYCYDLRKQKYLQHLHPRNPQSNLFSRHVDHETVDAMAASFSSSLIGVSSSFFSFVPSSLAISSMSDAYAVVEDSTAQTFAPVLNVGALVSFLFITIVFVTLQVRVTAIGEAVDRRTEALEALRIIKTKQLSSGGGGSDSSNSKKKNNNGDDDDDNGEFAKVDDPASVSLQAQVDRAVENYRIAFEEVERLRTIIPGIARIRPPPSTNTPVMQRMSENAAAAKQFLGIDAEDYNLLQTDDTSSNKKEKGSSTSDNTDDDKLSLPLPLALLLGTIVLAQIGLFALLMTDPMPTVSNDVFSVVEDLAGME